MSRAVIATDQRRCHGALDMPRFTPDSAIACAIACPRLGLLSPSTRSVLCCSLQRFHARDKLFHLYASLRQLQNGRARHDASARAEHRNASSARGAPSARAGREVGKTCPFEPVACNSAAFDKLSSCPAFEHDVRLPHHPSHDLAAWRCVGSRVAVQSVPLLATNSNFITYAVGPRCLL